MPATPCGVSAEPATPDAAPRGVVGDLWADAVIGKRDFAEISAREIVPSKVNQPGGVIVDRSSAPGKMYVWDSGNSRTLGVDLAICYDGAGPCSAQVVIGQPSGSDHGACNRDSSGQFYPDRSPAAADTLCGVSEFTHTTLEDKSFVSMYVDVAGDLFVPDFNNHRVLRYDSPFLNDSVADEVWGQADFAGNACNRAPRPNESITDASSLCFYSPSVGIGAGVAVDGAGSLWVADGGNNRVLRFPRVAGKIAKTADLVLGQLDFTDNGAGSALDQMSSPSAVRFDGQGRLYVVDGYNSRVLRFNPPFNASGRQADALFGNFEAGSPQSIEEDTAARGMWTLTAEAGAATLRLWNYGGTLIAGPYAIGHTGGGSTGIDTAGNLLVATYAYGQDVFRLAPQQGGGYAVDRQLFSPPGGYNLTTARRLEHPSWAGVEVVGDQLVVADGRILFWNGLAGMESGQAPDGYLAASSATQLPSPGFVQMDADADGRLWIARAYPETEVRMYQAPLATGLAPVAVIGSHIPALGGGQVDLINIGSVAVTAHSEFIWIADVDTHRVLRVRNPLSQPLVDVVLGQAALDGTQCNRGAGASSSAPLDFLCYPGGIALDRNGNLFVSDDFPELAGNLRLLMFSRDSFPTNNTQIIYAVKATKSFPGVGAPDGSGYPAFSNAMFQPAFDSQNHMVVGTNPYLGDRFAQYFLDPTSRSPANPGDPRFAIPDGHLRDFSGWQVAAAFASNDDLFVLDANRGQVRVYRRPFASAQPKPARQAEPGEIIWVDDQLPAGSNLYADKEFWSWTSAPDPIYSGVRAHVSPRVAGKHMHWFSGADSPVAIDTGATVSQWVYVPEGQAPREILMEFSDGSSWDHRVYWGENVLGWPAVSGGAIPGQGDAWVRLTVTAAQLGLEGKSISGISFVAYDGSVRWDRTSVLTRAPAAPFARIRQAGSDRQLSWSHVTQGADGSQMTITRYEVWQGAHPYFSLTEDQPGVSRLPDVLPPFGATVSLADTASMPADSSCFYSVRSVAGLAPSAPSNRVGAFVFGLVRGG